MRPAFKLLMIAGSAASVVACHKQEQQQPQQQDQNITVDNGMPANADIETLPADESSATPSNQLQNGSDNADVNTSGEDENSD